LLNIEFLSFLIPILIGAPTVLFSLYKFVNWVVRSSDRLKHVFVTVESINEKFSKNSGSSIADKIDKIVDNVQLIKCQARSYCDELQNDTGMLETDVTGKVIWANHQFSELTGISLEATLNNGWLNSVHISDRQLIFKEFHIAIEQARDFELTYKCANNYTVKMRGKIMKDDDGVSLGVLCFINRIEQENQSAQ